MKFEDLNEGSLVQIVNPNNEWDGLYGVVENIYEEIRLAQVFCVNMPCYHCNISDYNMDDIIKVEIDY